MSDLALAVFLAALGVAAFVCVAWVALRVYESWKWRRARRQP
jgi:hypothetical protein